MTMSVAGAVCVPSAVPVPAEAAADPPLLAPVSRNGRGLAPNDLQDSL